MNKSKEIEIEEGDIIEEITEKAMEICHSSKSTEKVATSSSCLSRKRKLSLSNCLFNSDVCECGRNITRKINFYDFLGNDPIFTEKKKFEKQTETIPPALDQSNEVSTELTLFVKSDFLRSKEHKESDDTTAQKLKKFSIYTPEEEEFERVSQVSTKLRLGYEDPWKIKKVLRQSECETRYRLMLEKDAFEQYVLPWIKIDEKVLENNGKEFKVWDYDTKTEHVMKLDKWSAHYVFNNWKIEFVKRRGLKCGDEIGIFWNTVEDRFWFRVLAIAPAAI